MKKLSLVLMLVLFAVGITLAQRTVTGTITDDGGETLIGANVLEKGTANGTTTEVDGTYSLSVADGATLVISYVGYDDLEVAVDGRSVVDIQMETGQTLDEVVVTGVAAGTSTKELGFTVGKINEQALQEVPGVDPANALRGKTPGVRVVSASGNPSSAPEVRLRSSTSISGNQSPLYLMDGIILDGNLSDININDIRSIEIVKGSASSALYGSLAGNGVIQLLSRIGSGKAGKTKVIVTNEYGFDQIARDYPLATQHPFQNDPQGVRSVDYDNDPSTPEINNFGFLLDAGGNRIIDPDKRFDGEYLSGTFDNIGNTITGSPFFSNYIGLGATEDKFGYYLSFHNLQRGGVVEGLEPYKRRNFRANVTFRPTDKWKISLNSLYATVDGVNVTEQGQGNNLFFGLLTAEPYINLTEKGADGNFSEKPAGYDLQQSNFQNPLYVGGVLDFGFDRKRLIGGVSVSYDVTENLTLSATRSIDRSDNFFFFIEPKDYQNPDPGNNRGGAQTENTSETLTEVTAATAQYKMELAEETDLRLTLSYLLEERSSRFSGASGTSFAALGLRNLGALTENLTANSGQTESISENVFLDANLGLMDKFFINGMVRRDGSSLFGENERYQIYGRGSLAYILSEDVKVDFFNLMKLRVSYGISGQRPPFDAQYQTFQANNTGINPVTLGNPDLKPSRVSELEFGLDTRFANDRYGFSASYAIADVVDDYILVPLTVGTAFTSQWQNIGEIRGTAIELGLTGRPIDKNGFSIDFSLNWDRITQEITSLGGVPDFTQNTTSAFDLFRVEEGLPYGTMYGNKVITSLDELTVDADGNVLNAIKNSGVLLGEGAFTKDDFMINSDGYVVPKFSAATDADGNVIPDVDVDGDGVYDPADGDKARRISSVGTGDEQVVYLADEDGATQSVSIGNTNPDWNLGLAVTFKYKGISLYVLIDHQQGGDIYNYTKQLLYFNDRHGDLQDYAAEGKHTDYSNGSSNIYNLASASSHFVEDGTFTKIREISLGYTFNNDQLGRLGKYLSKVKFAVAGRNLFTFTNYSGWDPEVALGNNPTNFRLDEYSYPNFRTFTGSLTLEF
ncbi:MAG: SusC/RagA family TonB-linked outer membrane protein [Saprospiraceae bacterium]